LAQSNREREMLKQLAERYADGIIVELFWDDCAPAGSDVVVEYRDERRGVRYTVYPPRDRALEAFNHPNAYAAVAPVAA
jgi:hypothetical protein